MWSKRLWDISNLHSYLGYLPERVVLTWKEASASINPDSHGLESKDSIDTGCFSIQVPLVLLKKID